MTLMSAFLFSSTRCHKSRSGTVKYLRTFSGRCISHCLGLPYHLLASLLWQLLTRSTKSKVSKNALPGFHFLMHSSLPPVIRPPTKRKGTRDHTKQSDMDALPSQPVADLGWSQVGFALTFIAFNSIISQVLQLGVGTSIMSAALRCVVQLTLMATVLQQVFAAENFWAVLGISCKNVVVCLAAVP